MLFPRYDWELEGLDISEAREEGQRQVPLRDGTQVWRNTRFDDRREVRPSGPGT
jgi:hypothetical protein